MLSRFNPRPPRKVGATGREYGLFGYFSVSILAHLARWALRAGGKDEGITLRVSILAHLARWALQARSARLCLPVPCFNPRPPRKVGATSISSSLGTDATRFQSSPTSQGGRYETAKGVQRYDLDVSILAHLARWALHALIPISSLIAVVSILAHLARWALRRQTARKKGKTMFQSSPTSQGGRYAAIPGCDAGDLGVSILAHLARWALPAKRST